MKKRDLILILSLLLLSVIMLIIISVFSKDGSYVTVRVDGKEVCKYSLSEDGVYELNGGSNILHIEGGFAFLSEADCPDKTCVKQGKIKKKGQIITCLPNKLTVTVYGQPDEVDIIS